jgi:putative nucleotidyltransferase with HDIG domain
MAARDLYTQGHAYRVAAYSWRVAQRIGLPPEEVGHIGIGGLFHDIGKIVCSDRVFSSQSILISAKLAKEIRQHPEIGAALLRELDFFDPVLDFVLYHHERADGTGYPFGLKLDEIPRGAQIISVADCFDAITTDRPYQKGKSLKEAFVILRTISGNVLAPDLVESFVQEIVENGMMTI